MLGHEVMHLLVHGDGLPEHVAVVDCVPLTVGEVEHRLELIFVEAVDDVPEVFLVALPPLIDFGRHVRFDVGAVSKFSVQLLHGKLGIVADIHLFDGTLRQQALLLL